MAAAATSFGFSMGGFWLTSAPLAGFCASSEIVLFSSLLLPFGLERLLLRPDGWFASESEAELWAATLRLPADCCKVRFRPTDDVLESDSSRVMSVAITRYDRGR
jgi:hypothetical protein